jgi:hypothetical protein
VPLHVIKRAHHGRLGHIQPGCKLRKRQWLRGVCKMFDQAQDSQGARVFTVIRRTGVGSIVILKRFSHILFHFLVSLEILIDGRVRPLY